jgi:YfiH family protein
MTRLPPGVAFSDATDGDVRNDLEARARLSARLGISDLWATLRQVHGSRVVRAEGSGVVGEADALWTTETDLPLAVYTADCFGVVMLSSSAVGVAHAGWRGAASGVVTALRAELEGAGHEVRRAAIGPGIRSCCFEVGDEVVAQFEGHVEETTWGTASVDLVGVLTEQLAGIDVEVAGGCTRHDDRFFSHRRDGLPRRQVTIGWVG